MYSLYTFKLYNYLEGLEMIIAKTMNMVQKVWFVIYYLLMQHSVSTEINNFTKCKTEKTLTSWEEDLIFL